MKKNKTTTCDSCQELAKIKKYTMSPEFSEHYICKSCVDSQKSDNRYLKYSEGKKRAQGWTRI